ncbi:HNH endonuclease [Solibacillus sp. FSL W8-0474]|uniref:HNH endonuclease n=1 Tax=Solibacillus sp. FSL W8-0474 TaxID=2975336 RepID=UPI0030FC95C0
MERNKGLDLIGQEFGRLKVVSDTGKRHPTKGKIWLCICECNSTKEVASTYLKRGSAKSCGCLRRESKRKGKTFTQKIYNKPTVEAVIESKKHIDYAIVEDGLFLVFKDKSIYSIRDNYALLRKTIPLNEYQIVTVVVNKRQRHYYTHRLLALAFVPNPEGKKVVSFRDGNPKNLEIENLFWLSQNELIKNNEKESVPCNHCGKNKQSRNLLCVNCSNLIKRENAKLERERLRIKELNDTFPEQVWIHLTEKQLLYIKLYIKGYKQKEIAEIFGVSSQAVNRSIADAKKRIKKIKGI